MVIIHKIEQGSPEWHELRKDKWTGSRAIKLLQGKPLPDDNTGYQNFAMRRGQILEPIAIREFTQQTGIDTLQVGFVTNESFPQAGYSPDGVIGDTLIEVKCLNGERHEKLARGDIPIEYMAQVQFGMVICDLYHTKLLAFNPEYVQQLTIIDVPYDKKIAENIKNRLLLEK